MALIQCPNCGKQFSEHAKACPQCGISMDEALLLIQKREEEIRLANEREAAERERQRQEYFAEQERIREEREAKEAEEARIRAEKRTAWWAANKKKVVTSVLIVLAIIGVAVTCIVVANNGKSAEKDDTQIEKTTDNSTEKIQEVLSGLSANCSKNGNTERLSDLFAETVNPYVKEGNTKKSKDIPESMRKFLSRYDSYEMSSPTDLNVQSHGNGYIATYNIIVEWNSDRTGHKKACLHKTTYFNSEYKITGFIDNELWRESVTNAVESKAETTEDYIDLGLTSGTRWKTSNEPGMYTFDRALDKFGDRLPTKEQCEELIAQCSWKWLGKGYRATGPNGRTIDFPLTGYCDTNGRMYNTDIRGSYWSCTPGPSGVAWKLYIDDDEVTMYRYHRNIGHAVRLVED